jgi:Fe2+ transport system protein B
MRIYENSFDSASKKVQQDSNVQQIAEKAQQLFKHRSNAERHRSTNLASILLSYVCNLFSGLTTMIASTFIIYQSLKSVNHYFALIVALIFSLVLVCIIEAIKRYSLKECIVDAIQYKKINFGLAFIVLLFCSISIASSWKGAQLLPQLTTSEPNLINIDSLQAKYEQQIAEATALYTYKPTKTITKKGAPILASMQEEKRQAIAEAKATNKERSEANKDSIQLDSNLFAGIALGVELLFIVSFLFSMHYYFKCFLETIAIDQEQHQAKKPDFKEVTKIVQGENTTQTGKQDTPSEAPRAEAKKQIGFKLYESRKNVIIEGTRTCLHCNKAYVHKHNKQKFCSTTCRMDYHKTRRLSSKS